MFPSEAVSARVLQILEAARQQRKQLTAAAQLRGLTLEQLLAAAITEAVRETLTSSAATGR
jgi:hypothetical protein